MLTTNNYYVALALTVITMLTWGTNKVAVKYLTYSVAFYTIDYFTWVFIFHIIFGLTIGADYMPPELGYGMISNLREIINHDDAKGLWVQLGGPALAGASTAAFSLIMFALTDGFGLTSAIPLLFGSAMLFGVIASYYVEDPARRGNKVLVFSGVAILFFAVLLNTIASRMNSKSRKANSSSEKDITKPLLDDQQKSESVPAAEAAPAPAVPAAEAVPAPLPAESAPAPAVPAAEAVPAPLPAESAPAAPTAEALPAPSGETTVPIPEPKEAKKLSMTMFVVLGLLGAFFDFFYAPCTAMGSSGDIPLSPYGVFLVASFASFVVVYPLAYILMRWPVKGAKATWKEYFQATWKQRWPAIWSAALLAIGNVCFATAGSTLSTTISYALSRGTLLVSALLGILCYKEFNGANASTWATQIIALILFVVAIVVEAMAAKK
ncbi:uncharacterized protein [Blastocystis hominis]|uniref:EamA domain-containing protein n=1 Tax=Blastocystis hominis TaxID=12968 RepID=D8LYG4_BLAHO|nr:uncharacterized protein [Blastocystis hominis]CBK20619.2 unnamed protein product [Blastocystis hominis]|eukprot:XP_012894667.1 uncharacterized protein [Blastocystis hominis]